MQMALEIEVLESSRAALVSGSKRQPVSQSIPIVSRPMSSNSTSSTSSPTFSNIEHIRSYSLSRTHSDQSSHMATGLSIPSANRRTSMSDVKEKSRRGNSQMARAPKSLREWHEQPVNLLEQPYLLQNVNVQILSPNSDRTNPPFFCDNEILKSEENLNAGIENDNNQTIHRASDVNENK
ncbi:unnamed protein product [Rotaria sordida]|uniref:Uncharacterized protein n=1 Tax=Rotaria sordida TaxID=392033 RepID=A0A814MC78_9BILA|nr:unnamed protein product [Rotaria sordida]CAF1115500.1 unnamed protein product [Rotaria sordida]CAF1228319.1 unnamed protein product [Rotaria sordida]CAF3662158.1 unnamed protein product [Rotaria sordida]CAF3699484.1 unnamed protein product [Rotaria sordida]